MSLCAKYQLSRFCISVQAYNARGPGVKVREFIHYSKKNSAGSRQRFGDQGQGQRGGNVGVVAGGAGHQYQAQQHGEQRGPPQLLLAPNRYSLPEDRVPGGPPLQV